MKKQDFSEIEYKQLDMALLKRLLAFLKPYKIYIYYSLLLAILTSALGPIRPYLTKIAVDNHIAIGDSKGLIIMIIIILALTLFNGLSRFGLTYLMLQCIK